MTTTRKNTTVTDELAQLMQGYLSGNLEKTASDKSDATQAIELLNSAADLFEDVGYVGASEAITTILEKIASKVK